MNWSFAIVNGRLAEIYFEKGKKPKVFAHGYVKESWFKTKKENDMIAKDIQHTRLSYRKGKYKKLRHMPEF